MTEQRDSLSFQPYGSGCCERCGQYQDELYLATLTSGEQTESMAMCGECALRLKSRVDRHNAQQTQMPAPPVPAQPRQTPPMNPQQLAPMQQAMPMQQTPQAPRTAPTSVQGSSNHDVSKKRKKRRKHPVLAIVLTVILLTFAVCGIIIIAYNAYLKGDKIDFIEMKSLASSDETSFDKEYNHKRFRFCFVPSETPESGEGNSYHGKILDSYGNDWGEDAFEQWELFFPYSELTALTAGEPYYFDGTLDFFNLLTSDSFDTYTFMVKDIIRRDPPNKSNSTGHVQSESFAIEGKWKNVGDVPCAQMRIGSITSFDGTYCNVYSPHDTYAFYESDGVYHLDCTSFFAGDSLCFTVEIIDTDTIELTNGSTTVRLARVA